MQRVFIVAAPSAAPKKLLISVVPSHAQMAKHSGSPPELTNEFSVSFPDGTSRQNVGSKPVPVTELSPVAVGDAIEPNHKSQPSIFRAKYCNSVPAADPLDNTVKDVAPIAVNETE